MLNISEIKALPGNRKQPFEAVVVLQQCSERRARNNNRYLSITFGDRTGTFTALCFEDHPHFEALLGLEEGMVVRVSGQTDHYQDRFSPSLTSIEALSEAEASGHANQLFETCPEDIDTLWTELQSCIDLIRHDVLRATVKRVVNELEAAMRTAPGGARIHHAYRGGLLEHTVHVAQAARILLPLYPEVEPDLALAGAIVHDVGKCFEYSPGPVYQKERTGILQGHVVTGYREVRRAGMIERLDTDRLERLEHIVLSHQGELEWGAAVKAATPEALFVSLVDNLDAKMGIVQQTLRRLEGQDGFSDHNPALGSPILLDTIEQEEGESRSASVSD